MFSRSDLCSHRSQLRGAFGLSEGRGSYPGEYGLPLCAQGALHHGASQETTGPSPPSQQPADCRTGPSHASPGQLGSTVVTDRLRYEQRTTPRLTTVIDAARMSMDEFARILSSNLDLPVVDRTELKAVYRFSVELDLDQRAQATLGHPSANSSTGGTRGRG